ncbi:MAG: 30S ribosomal protein S8 [bacterium]|nr:30S ribosomal protein S8 [bacterium]
MTVVDPIADMLTRIRNAQNAYHEKVDIPASKIKMKIVTILKKEGFIKYYKFIEDRKQGIIRVYLKYSSSREKYITKLVRVSKPGLRVYVNKEKVSRVLNGLGVAIISTSKGVLTDIECRKLNVGGEILCYIW